jgi:tetratricopeptide (TPR) repeat protein
MSRYANRIWAVILVTPLLSAAPGGSAPGGPATIFPSTPPPAEIFPAGAPPATETFHDESEPLHRRVDRRLAAGRYADALGLVRAKAETLRHTRHGEEIIEALARHYSVAGRPEDAQALYQSLMKRDRDNARLHTETGNAYRDNGRYAEALPHFRAGQDQNHPNRYLAMLDEAACLVALGRYVEARRITAWMVHDQVMWRGRAQQLGDAVAHAQGGSPAAELQLAYGFLSGFGDGDALAHPGVAAAIASRVLANWATGAVQKR